MRRSFKPQMGPKGDMKAWLSLRRGEAGGERESRGEGEWLTGKEVKM
jgi:hypothetical protein